MNTDIGTRVDFYGAGHAPDTAPQLAFVTHDFGDGTVNVAVFDRNGRPQQLPPTQIPLLADGDKRPERPCCVLPESVVAASSGVDNLKIAEILESFSVRLDFLGTRLDGALADSPANLPVGHADHSGVLSESEVNEVEVDPAAKTSSEIASDEATAEVAEQPAVQEETASS